jgi:molybdenum cofactor cytidylyltransferase
MIAADRVALVLLAAGRSTRFGSNKLLAELEGKPLIRHAADTLIQAGFGWTFAVCTGETAPLLGDFEIVTNSKPEAGQARSIRLGVQRAMETGCGAVMIALGDMPFVSAAHLDALLAATGEVVASAAVGKPMPPALFARARARDLLALDGDRGARDLLASATLVHADPRVLRDVDTRDQLPR